ncbi:FRAS1-related extracellular matrix protein 1 [Platysternon megacephalum]|uniref:FRAS1-related extracellular matrix protein 1 n=1 Tax=Platysternon megacephalum TaxID=55544 RepID=A0A4D9FDJ1_9SAUR|nr:FRAS1-related extracellular matrix protein 1 [Platysternon megacephalum]
MNFAGHLRCLQLNFLHNLLYTQLQKEHNFIYTTSTFCHCEMHMDNKEDRGTWFKFICESTFGWPLLSVRIKKKTKKTYKFAPAFWHLKKHLFFSQINCAHKNKGTNLEVGGDSLKK